jgi:hypothetical protein
MCRVSSQTYHCICCTLYHSIHYPIANIPSTTSLAASPSYRSMQRSCTAPLRPSCCTRKTSSSPTGWCSRLTYTCSRSLSSTRFVFLFSVRVLTSPARDCLLCFQLGRISPLSPRVQQTCIDLAVLACTWRVSAFMPSVSMRGEFQHTFRALLIVAW